MTTTIAPIRVTIPMQVIEFDPWVWLEHTGNIHYAISYWGEIKWGETGIQIKDHEDGKSGSASWWRVSRVIEALGRGKRLDLEEREHDWGNVDDYANRACRDFIHNPSEADGDTEVDDVIVQISVFGEVVYG